ncbi:MAG: hypothetical protein ACR2MG_12065 [Pyrinomonadaceae bacterium]
MQTKHKLNHSLFIFGLVILLFGAACPLVQAQTSPNDIFQTKKRIENNEKRNNAARRCKARFFNHAKVLFFA